MTDAPPPAPWFQGVEGIDAELTGHIQTKGWDKLTPQLAAAAAARSQREAEKLIGAPADKMIRLPNDPKDEAAWKGVWQRLGAPADAKDYDFSTVKLADGKDPDAAIIDFARQQAAALNLPKEAAAKMADAFVKQSETAAKTARAEYDATLIKERAELDKNWGANKEANMFVAKKAAAALGLDQEALVALEKTVGYKKVMDMFLAVGQKIGEDKFIANPAPGGNGVMTREQALARKEELKSDAAWQKRYFDGGAPERREMDALMVLLAR